MATTDKLWTVNDIKEADRANGGHWFDPGAMRFFGTKVLPEVYQGKGGIYFVTSEQPPHGKRAYTVRQFDPEGVQISTVGDVASLSKAAAIRLANKKAAGDLPGFSMLVPPEEGGIPWQLRGVKTTAEKFRPVSVLEQFLYDLDRHGDHSWKAAATDAKRIIALAARHHRLMVLRCNDEDFCRRNDDSLDGGHPDVAKCRERIRRVAEQLGAKGVIFQGDPRGYTVKLTFNDGFTNDFAKEGYCVPTSLTED